MIVRNISWNFIGQLWLLGLSVLCLPYVVNTLGGNAYGVLALVLSVTGCLSFLDLGLGAALTKYIAEHHERGDYGSIRDDMGTALVVYSAIGVVGMGVLFGIARPMATRWLQVPADLGPSAVLAIRLSALGFSLNMALAVFEAVPTALQRMDLTNLRNMALGSTSLLGAVVIVGLGRGLVSIVLLNTLLSFAGVIIYAGISRRLLPGVRLRPCLVGASARRLLAFGSFKFFSALCGIVVFHLDRLLIAFFLPIAALTFYHVPMTLAQKMLQAIGNVTLPVFPAVAAAASDRAGAVRKLYFRWAKGVLLMVLPPALFLMIFADQVMTAWMGPAFAKQSAAVLAFLVLAYLLASFSAVPTVIAEGVGRPDLPAIFAGISALLNISFSLLLIPRYGIVGAAWALALNALIQVPVFIHQVNRQVLGLSSWELTRKSYLRPFAGGLTTTVLWFLTRPYTHGVMGLAIIGLLGFCFYGWMCYRLGCLDGEERSLLGDRAHRIVRGVEEFASAFRRL